MKKQLKRLFVDKKGGEKYLSFWWILVFVVVSLGIAAGVYMHNSMDIDLRKTEAGILSEKIVNC